MRICIDIRPTLKKKTGIGYYTLNLINALAGIDEANQYSLYSQKGFFDFKKKLLPLPGKNFRYLTARTRPKDNKICGNFDIYHTSSFDILPDKGVKLVAVVHDIIPRVFPQGHTEDAINRLNDQLGTFLQHAGRVITDSECSKADLIRHFSVPAERIRVIYPGVGEDFCRLPEPLHNVISSKYNIYSDYILYAGTIEPRKNVTGLIRAFAVLKQKHNIKQKLVILGMKGWMHDEVYDLIKKLDLGSDVIFTGYVPREDLKIFYNLADVFAYPSLYEGAGLPVLEAFACSAAVVTSKASCLPEIAGDAAVLIDPNDPQDIANGILKILEDEDFRSKLKEKGSQRAKEFTWDRTARQTLEVFNAA